jgi:hypothetical protein
MNEGRLGMLLLKSKECRRIKTEKAFKRMKFEFRLSNQTVNQPARSRATWSSIGSSGKCGMRLAHSTNCTNWRSAE